MDQVTEVEKSSGNVFADLDIPDSSEFLAKAKITAKICDLFIENDVGLAKAAELFEIEQSELYNLMQGQLDSFSLERLFRWLNILDQDVDILIRPKQNPDWDGEIRVTI
ncbi:MAG: helix-turn-helix domain-containing protein [Microcoleaceae cyanobacterium]